MFPGEAAEGVMGGPTEVRKGPEALLRGRTGVREGNVWGAEGGGEEGAEEAEEEEDEGQSWSPAGEEEEGRTSTKDEEGKEFVV